MKNSGFGFYGLMEVEKEGEDDGEGDSGGEDTWVWRFTPLGFTPNNLL